MSDHLNIGEIAGQFEIQGEFYSAYPYGTGHINDTYCVEFEHSSLPARYILQRINRNVFKDPAGLMQNIVRVTEHLARQVAGEPDRRRRALTHIPARDGCAWHVDAHGEYWRAYRFIEGASSYDSIESPQQAYQAARAFGRFQSHLASMPASELHETIPDFHNTPKRFQSLQKAIADDVAQRATGAAPEIDFALKHEPIANLLLAAGLPLRVTHNDTKLNNVLIDDATGEGVCVIDLDTVMPGLAPFDFGDMVRTATSPTQEDERDLSRVKMEFPMFEALLHGYLSAAGEFLTVQEREQMVNAGKVIAFEQGIRFLADFLSGDPYYKVSRPAHNLDRCRTQFKLFESIEQQENAMYGLLRSIV